MDFSVEKKVGIFFLLTLVALGVMIEMVEEWHPFESQTPYHTHFEAVIGLNPGDPVRMAGVQVGKVKAITLEEGRVRVDFYVTGEAEVRQDSVAEVRRTNLLGGVFLGIRFGSSDSPLLESGSEVQSMDIASIDQVIANFDRNQERVLGGLGDVIEESRGKLIDTVSHLENVTRKIDQGEGLLGTLVNDRALSEDLQKTVASLRGLTGRLERGEGTLGRLFTDPALYQDAAVTMANLRSITGQVASGQGSVGRLFQEDRLYVNAADALEQFREIADKANRGEGTLGRLVNDPSLYDETRETMARINSIAGKIDEGEGTLGRLLNDDDIYRDAKTALKKVEKAADGLSDSGPISALGTVIGTLF